MSHICLRGWMWLLSLATYTAVAQGEPRVATHDAPASPQPSGPLKRGDTDTMFPTALSGLNAFPDCIRPVEHLFEGFEHLLEM